MSAADIPASDTDRAVAAKAATAVRPAAPNKITWLTLALMTTSSVASLRAAPTMAVCGLACVFLYLLPAVVFLLPTALVSAELASGWSGGVYNWVAQGLSKPLGFLAVWCQFAMTIFYYPSLLAYVAGTIAYVINPSLASNGVYTAIVIVVVYWTGVWVSSRGTNAVAGLASWGLIIGTLIPGALLVLLGFVFLGQGNPSVAPMNASHIFPEWTGVASLVLIVNNFLSYSGMEMNAVHVNKLRNPAKEFPKSMFVAMGLVLLIFILPALAISWVIPADQLSLTAGVMQAFDAFFQYFHIGWLVPIVAFGLVAASVGGMLTWLAGPSKGLLLISKQEGYLPPFLQKLNKHGVQQNILVVQGAITTVIALLYALIPDVSSVYWIFSVITTQVYLIVYLLMFVAAVQLRSKQPNHPRGYRGPMLTTVCAIGLVASALAMAIGFVPSSQFGGGGAGAYIGIVGGGLLLLGLVIPFAFLKLRKPSWRQPDTTRTVHVGADIPAEVAQVHDVVRRAQQAAFEAVRPGVACQEIDRVARAVITEAGYGEYFIHRTGHGIGLTTHEPPYMVEGEEQVMVPGMCFSIEPGVYLPGRFGVRIEDIVTVTDTAGRRLNNTPHDLGVVA